LPKSPGGFSEAFCRLAGKEFLRAFSGDFVSILLADSNKFLMLAFCLQA